LVDAGKALTLSEVISGSGTLIKSGGGDLVLSGANTYTGATTVLAGALLFATRANKTALTSAFRIASGATLNLNSQDVSIGSLADVGGAGGVVTGGAFGDTSLTIGSNNKSTRFSGTIQDASVAGRMSLTKIGTGTQTLAGANSYSGGTTV